MENAIVVFLEWSKPIKDPKNISGEAGIYMVLSGNQTRSGKIDVDSYKVLDIGQTEDVSERFNNHGREDEWGMLEICYPDNDVRIFKFAEMSKDKYSEKQRRAVECCIRFKVGPLIAGTECIENYNNDYHVKITNVGNNLPLEKEYECKPT